jgi:hypothetical protein
MVVFGVTAMSERAAAQATYSYTGNPFTFFSCGPNSDDTATKDCSADPAPGNTLTSYTATDHVTATLTLDSPLGPNFAFSDIKNLSGFSLILDDGEHVVSTPLSPGEGLIASVGTDANGNIDQWQLVLNTGGLLNGGISTINFINTSGTAVAEDEGVLACCDPTVSGNLALNLSMAGTWSGGSTPPSPTASVNNLIVVISNPSLGLTSGQISSLTDKLNNVLASIQAGQDKQAINQLNAFINSVQSSVKTGKISVQTGGTLIAAANAIIAVL